MLNKFTVNIKFNKVKLIMNIFYLHEDPQVSVHAL